MAACNICNPIPNVASQNQAPELQDSEDYEEVSTGVRRTRSAARSEISVPLGSSYRVPVHQPSRGRSKSQTRRSTSRKPSKIRARSTSARKSSKTRSRSKSATRGRQGRK